MAPAFFILIVKNLRVTLRFAFFTRNISTYISSPSTIEKRRFRGLKPLVSGTFLDFHSFFDKISEN